MLKDIFVLPLLVNIDFIAFCHSEQRRIFNFLLFTLKCFLGQYLVGKICFAEHPRSSPRSQLQDMAPYAPRSLLPQKLMPFQQQMLWRSDCLRFINTGMARK